MAVTSKEKITLEGSPITVLTTLWIRHCHRTRSPPGSIFIDDPWATETVEKIDFDFSKIGTTSFTTAYISIRCSIFDRWATEVLQSRTEPLTILQLACGLDSRSLRLNPLYENEPGIRWIDVDIRPVVDLRRRLLPEPKGDYTLLSLEGITDDWLQQIPTDRRVVVIAEGLMMFLQPEVGKQLLHQVVSHFPLGGELHFDMIPKMKIRTQSLINGINNVGAHFRWGIDSSGEIEEVHGRIKFKSALRASDVPGATDLPDWWGWMMMIMTRWLFTFNTNIRFTF